MVLLGLGLFTPASAKDIFIGLGGGVHVPDASDSYKLGVTFYGNFLYEILPKFLLDGGLGYWNNKDKVDAWDASISVMPYTAGICYRLTPLFHLDAGMGAYKAWSSVSNVDVSVPLSDATHFGIYGGAGVFINNKFNVKARFHSIEASGIDISITVGILFRPRIYD